MNINDAPVEPIIGLFALGDPSHYCKPMPFVVILVAKLIVETLDSLAVTCSL